ncbi:MAG: hypothetical protein AVDCRST_MAG19-1724 [uncultured Thermomicrobiales bacterium]|uniref:Uncharacterized protein n=1 Tax=uncultured Thermomicrobiales bacterium TaxID=1645740 RepID=A0A6J4USZ6_9BACT|nr:MAG: hypothetical protein AVDCRST_MAG19-1724 [uncultured Thermomicrobiales bacterium]
MTARPTKNVEPQDRDLYSLLEEMDRLEDVLEEMTELGVASRSEIELRLAALNREVDERSDV